MVSRGCGLHFTENLHFFLCNWQIVAYFHAWSFPTEVTLGVKNLLMKVRASIQRACLHTYPLKFYIDFHRLLGPQSLLNPALGCPAITVFSLLTWKGTSSLLFFRDRGEGQWVWQYASLCPVGIKTCVTGALAPPNWSLNFLPARICPSKLSNEDSDWLSQFKRSWSRVPWGILKFMDHWFFWQSVSGSSLKIIF